jgi:hypothetical protein
VISPYKKKKKTKTTRNDDVVVDDRHNQSMALPRSDANLMKETMNESITSDFVR